MSYALFSAILTGLVVLLVGVVTPGSLSTALQRLLDTVIGGGLALAAYVIWPTWTQTAASATFAELARAQAAYLEAVLGVVAGRRTASPLRAARPRPHGSIGPSRGRVGARPARSRSPPGIGSMWPGPAGSWPPWAASASPLTPCAPISKTTAFPSPSPRWRRWPTPWSRALRIIASVLVLTMPTATRTLSSVAGRDRVRGPSQLPPLRRRYADLQDHLADRPGALGPPAGSGGVGDAPIPTSEAATLLADADELVDAINTLAAVTGLGAADNGGGDMALAPLS